MPLVRKQVAVFMSNILFSSLPPPSLHPWKLWLFSSQVRRAVQARLLMACRHLSISRPKFDSYLSPTCELLNSVNLFCFSWGRPSANWGHFSACNGGLRLWAEVTHLMARWRRTAATDAKTLRFLCACVRTMPAPAHCVSTGLTHKDMHPN